jgi:hypothetical protein
VLKVAEEDLFRSSAPTFSETPEVEDKKIEAFAHEVFGKFPPTFYAPRVAFYVKNNPLAVGHSEVKRIDHATIFHVKIDLRKRERVLVREGFGQSFRAKEKKVLPKVEQETQPDIHRGWPKKDIEPKQHLRAKVGRLVADLWFVECLFSRFTYYQASAARGLGNCFWSENRRFCP